jgi:SAM-dependent methyltransferase
MSGLSDPKYLQSQYKDSANLSARAGLHLRFSTNPYGWHRWVFDQFDLPPTAAILELGCGPAWLWQQNRDRIPAGWQITLTDLSEGMLDEARQKLSEVSRAITFKKVDAQAIPFSDASFDGVIANHMLYHVPDRPRAIAEMRRVLKPGGRFYATTVGERHMQELDQLVTRFAPDTRLWSERGGPNEFSLENGAAQLTGVFSEVTLRRYADALVVTDADALITYALSGTAKATLTGERQEAFARFVAQEIAAQGAIRITKDSGLFIAS